MAQLSLLILLALAAFLGAREGWRVATLTEVDLIKRYAGRYLEAARARGASGPRLTDCFALPSARTDGWIDVHCAAPDGIAHRYEVSRSGRLIGSHETIGVGT